MFHGARGVARRSFFAVIVIEVIAAAPMTAHCARVVGVHGVGVERRQGLGHAKIESNIIAGGSDACHWMRSGPTLILT